MNNDLNLKVVVNQNDAVSGIAKIEYGYILASNC